MGLLHHDFPQVDPLLADYADGDISEDDLLAALKNMKNGKSPGSDGLSVDFYKAFWPTVKGMVWASLTSVLSRGTLSTEQRRGIICLIPKKHKDGTRLKNWHPITLLNVDFKMLTKALANKLVPCLNSIIGKEQTGFMRGRFIGENIRTVDDIIDFCRVSGKEGLLLQLDFEKAFDKVEWDAIFNALTLFGMGQNFVSNIRTLFSCIETTILNNGYTSPYFSPANGIRQGCSVSPYLFLITVEILAIGIRNNKSLKGIEVGKTEYKLAMYADDLTCFAQDWTAAERFKDALEQFSMWSGLKINWDKSEGMLMGPSRDSIPQGKWIHMVDKMQILGVTLRATNNTHTRYYDNFKPILGKMKTVLGQWKNRRLSLKGKIVVVNSLIVSLISYMTSVIYTPIRVIQETKHMICQYIWSDKRSKVSYNTLIQKIEQGGLKLADLGTRIKASYVQWVKRLVRPEGCMNDEIVKWALNWPYEMKRYFQAKSVQKKQYKETFSFYQELVNVWQEVHSYLPLEASQIKCESLWNNRFIADSKGPMQVNALWASKGIWSLGDLMDNGTFLSHEQLSIKYEVKCTFLDLLAIRQKIPAYWKEIQNLDTLRAQKGETEIYVNLLDNSAPSIDTIRANTMYWNIVAKRDCTIPAIEKWETEYPEVFTLKERARGIWRDILYLPFRVQKEVKYQSLQYMIIMRIVPCKEYLCRIKISESDLCEHCEVKDNISHFFVQCSKSKILWAAIFRWYNPISKEAPFMPTEQEVIFGVINEQKRKDTEVLNMLILLTKNFIHWKKLYHKGEMCITEWLMVLKRWINTQGKMTKERKRVWKNNLWERILKEIG